MWRWKYEHVAKKSHQLRGHKQNDEQPQLKPHSRKIELFIEKIYMIGLMMCRYGDEILLQYDLWGKDDKVVVKGEHNTLSRYLDIWLLLS